MNEPNPHGRDPELTLVTACTPDYLPTLRWTLPTWACKPQFRAARGGLILYHHGFKLDAQGEPIQLGWVREVFPLVRFIQWDMPAAANDRERMLSAFVLGAARDVETSHWIKLDADAVCTSRDDVFEGEDFEADIVSHPWGYTKPGGWINHLEAWSRGEKPVPVASLEPRADSRIISFCCLHRAEFVRWAAKLAGERLPVPSHDTYLWWLAEHVEGKHWHARNVKRRGVGHVRNKRAARELACASKAALNPVGFQDLCDHIQLEITTFCNLSCPNCDRNCGTAPSDERMTLAQVVQFLRESRARGRAWRRIDVIGGEPTLHPELLDILAQLDVYRQETGCQIRLTSNGTSKPVQRVLAVLPKWVKVRNSSAEKMAPFFDAVNLAPVDKGIKDAQACSIPWRCGLALTRYGYFPCGAGAAVARVFGIDCGLKSLADVTPQTVAAQLGALCRLCGHSRSCVEQTSHQETSESWATAFEAYKSKRPELPLYGEPVA